MTLILARLGKHAFGSYLLNENPTAVGGGCLRQQTLTRSIVRAKHNDCECLTFQFILFKGPYDHRRWLNAIVDGRMYTTQYHGVV